MSHHEWLLFVLYSEIILFKEPEHLRIENEQRHLLEVNSIDHKDKVRLRTQNKRGLNPYRPSSPISWATGLMCQILYAYVRFNS